MEIVLVPTKRLSAAVSAQREADAFERVERRLDSRPRLTFEKVKERWVKNARLHAFWIADPRQNDTYSSLYLSTLRTLQHMNADPENSIVYGRGKEIFEAYVAELNERVSCLNREVCSSLPGFDD